eukprot:COSAG02_NODE_6485_length_3543_cov_2.301394_1_plen_434_part_00
MLQGSFDGRTIAFDGTESAQARLDRLLGVAKQLEHPGIDDAGIETMKDYVRSGRFDNAHYIKIWSDRLEEMGVQFDGLYPLPESELELEPEAEQQPGAASTTEPQLEPEPEPEPDGVAAATDMTIVFPGSESDEGRLDRLLAKAMELEHPGIDPEGVETMKGFIAAGRFPHSHYIKMWTKRLEDMGVKISTGSTAPAGAPVQSSNEDVGRVQVEEPPPPESLTTTPQLEPAPSPPPAEMPPPAPIQPVVAPVAVEMEIVFTDAQGEEERLNCLLAKAMELEHPGIDLEGIETMKGFIAAGRFPHSHYIKMWTKRLEDMGVEIVHVTEPDISRLDSTGGGQVETGDGQAHHASTSADGPGTSAPDDEALPKTLRVDVSPINQIARPGGDKPTAHGVNSEAVDAGEQENYTPMRAEALRLGTELDGVSKFAAWPK